MFVVLSHLFVLKAGSIDGFIVLTAKRIVKVVPKIALIF